MILQIEHQTSYRFDTPATYSIQSLHLTPASFEGQRVLSWQVTAEPWGSLNASTDVFGNLVHVAARYMEHDQVTVRAWGRVETADTAGVVRGTTEPLAPRLYLRTTELTQPDRKLDALARKAAQGADGTLDACHRVMAAVRDAVDYQPGHTGTASTAAQALALGKGVCQDHAHVFIACARTLGIPARYAGGYMWDGDGRQDVEAGHGWAEAHVEELGWVGFDPSNRQCPTDAYVRVAVGLDYDDACPVRGIRRSFGAETLDVVVRVAQAGYQSQSQ
jgi:transglutaminase-like putative cysteine protease